MFGGSASSDMKLKPLLVYAFGEPRALKHIAKGSLPIICKSNVKAWVTQAIFWNWFFHQLFRVKVKTYCLERAVPFPASFCFLAVLVSHPLLMDDFYPSVIWEYICHWILTSLIQPGPGVIATFRNIISVLSKKILPMPQWVKNQVQPESWQFWKGYSIYEAIKNIEFAWCEVTAITVNRIWKNLCPQFVHDFHGFEMADEGVQEVFNNLVTSARSWS